MPALLNGGAIGTVQDVQGMQECFGFMLHNLQGNHCLNPELGGGVLLDAGSCAQSLIRLPTWQAPVRVLADARWADKRHWHLVQRHAALRRRLHGAADCAMDAVNHRRAVSMGTDGVVAIE